MMIQAELQQVIGEVKERNRLHRAMLHVRELAVIGLESPASAEVKAFFTQIVEQCDLAFADKFDGASE